MVPVKVIYEESRKIVGNDREDFIFRRLSDAVIMLATKGEFDPCVGSLDISVCSRVVTLPSEVDTVLAVNICGQPAVGRDQLFKFHLNGPGDCGPRVVWEWIDQGKFPVYRDMTTPSTLAGWCYQDEDENCDLWVYGYDEKGNVVRSKVGDEWRDGYKVPTFKTFHTVPDDAPLFSRITRVQKPLTAGPIRLSTLDNSSQTGILLGVYQHYETEPSFRRIRISRHANWVRIFYRRNRFEVRSQEDVLPIFNPQSVLMALRAIKKYGEVNGIPEAEAMEATAVRWEQEAQRCATAPNVHPMQVWDYNPLVDQADYVD